MPVYVFFNQANLMEATPRGIPSVQLLQITNSFLFLGENLHLCRINLIFCWKILTDNYNFVLDSATTENEPTTFRFFSKV